MSSLLSGIQRQAGKYTNLLTAGLQSSETNLQFMLRKESQETIDYFECEDQLESILAGRFSDSLSIASYVSF